MFSTSTSSDAATPARPHPTAASRRHSWPWVSQCPARRAGMPRRRVADSWTTHSPSAPHGEPGHTAGPGQQLHDLARAHRPEQRLAARRLPQVEVFSQLARQNSGTAPASLRHRRQTVGRQIPCGALIAHEGVRAAARQELHFSPAAMAAKAVSAAGLAVSAAASPGPTR